MEENHELEEVLRDFADWLRATGSGANRTVGLRLSVVRHIANLRGIDPVQIQTADVVAFLGRQGLSTNSRHAYYGHLASWCRWLVESGRRDLDPMYRMKRPRALRGRPRPLPERVIRDLLDHSTSWTRTYVLLALYAGLRVHEIAKFRGDDIGPEVITVRGKGGQLWEVPTHPVLWTEARKYPMSGWWFPSPHSKLGHVHGPTVGDCIRRELKKLGHPGTAHQLRHAFGTEVLRASGGQLLVAQQLLRHVSPQSTAIYTFVDDTERRSAVEALPGWAS